MKGFLALVEAATPFDPRESISYPEEDTRVCILFSIKTWRHEKRDSTTILAVHLGDCPDKLTELPRYDDATVTSTKQMEGREWHRLCMANRESARTHKRRGVLSFNTTSDDAEL